MGHRMDVQCYKWRIKCVAYKHPRLAWKILLSGKIALNPDETGWNDKPSGKQALFPDDPPGLCCSFVMPALCQWCGNGNRLGLSIGPQWGVRDGNEYTKKGSQNVSLAVLGRGIEPLLQDWESWVLTVIRTEHLERKTRLELATPTLARLCSTNWATSAYKAPKFL